METGFRAFGELKRDIRIYFSSSFLTLFAYSGLLGVLYNIYLSRLGLTAGEIGSINATVLLSFALASLPAGVIGRRVPFRTLLVAAVVLIGCGYAVSILAESFGNAGRTAGFVVGAVCAGAGAATFVVRALPFLMTCDPAHRTRVFSFRYITETVAVFAGATIAGFLPTLAASLPGIVADSAAAYRLSLVVGIPVLLAAIVMVARVGSARPADRSEGPVGAEEPDGAEEPERPKQAPVENIPWSSADRRRRTASFALTIVMIGTVTLCKSAATAPLRRFFNLYLDALATPAALIGIVFGFARLIGVAGSAISSALLKHLHPRSVAIPAQFLSTAMILVLAVASTPAIAVIAFALTMAFGSIGAPAYDLYHQSVVPEDLRLLMSGVFTMAFGLGSALSVFGGGFAIEALGFSRLFLASAVLSAIGSLIFALLVRRPMQDAEVALTT